MFKKKSIKDIDIKNKKLLFRVDFNVPLKDGKVTDNTKIAAAIPTIQYALDQNAAVILCSHFGRPKGKADPAYSLKPAAAELEKILNKPVKFSPDCIGETAEKYASELKTGEILVLENTRFHAGEKANDPEMSKQLAKLADIFVNDAFGSSHRAHASTEGVTHYLPAVAGLLMEKEIYHLNKILHDPEHPFTAIMGGAKISDKLVIIETLLKKADQVIIGGGIANTIFKAQGHQLGDSLVEDDVIEEAVALMKNSGNKLVLPVDVVIADSFDNNAEKKTTPVGDIPDGWRIMDIGPETVKKYNSIIETSATITWNGPMGVFEFPNFARGTMDIANAVAKSSAISVIGGGESAAAVKQTDAADKITHISTGGGAFLQMLAGDELPGLTSLLDS